MFDPASSAWGALDDELSQASVRFWWRDDDVADCTPALREFLSLTDSQNLPVSFAVIPGMLESEVVSLVARHEGSAVIQHGYLHVDHSSCGHEKCELSDDYPLDQLCQNLTRGRQVLLDAFGTKALPVVAPPWNRIGDAIRGALPSIGFRVVSLCGPRDAEFCVPGLAELNAHVDLIDWDAGGVYCGDTNALQQIVSHLKAKRLGLADPTEPTGILSHHGRICFRAQSFIVRLLTTIAAKRSTWVTPQSLFGPYL